MTGPSAMPQRRPDDHRRQHQHRDHRKQPPPVPMPGERLVGVGIGGRLCRAAGGLLRPWDLQSTQLGGERCRLGGECVVVAVPGDGSSAEPLGDDRAVLGLVGHRCAQLALGAPERVPGSVHRTADDHRTVIGRPEDDRVVLGGEGADPAVGSESTLGLTGGRETQIPFRATHTLVLFEQLTGDGIRPGGRAVEDLSAGEVLSHAVRTDRVLLAVLGAQRAHRAAGGPACGRDRRGRIGRNIQAGELTRQFRRHRGEFLGLAVPGDLAGAERLGDHVAVERLVPGRNPQRARRSADGVPCGVDGPADHPGSGGRGPEDDRIVRCAERRVAAVGGQSGTLVDGRKAQVPLGRTAQRLVLLQDRALHEMRAGLRGEEHLAPGEVLDEARAGRVHPALPRPERPPVAPAGLPCRGDRGVGIGFRGGRGHPGHHQGCKGECEQANCQPPSGCVSPCSRRSHGPSRSFGTVLSHDVLTDNFASAGHDYQGTRPIVTKKPAICGVRWRRIAHSGRRSGRQTPRLRPMISFITSVVPP